MTLKLLGIGGMGLMLSPSAKHLTADGPAKFIRVFDRGTKDERRDACRDVWKEHGAEIVGDYQALVGDNDFDGVVICAGKNGDDLNIFRSLTSLLNSNRETKPFVLHLSTVSSGFVKAANDFLEVNGVDYVNYPLTGGPLGAETANMLILASGNQSIYERLLPTLETIGKPKYFGNSITAGAEVKLMGQLMVFNGLVGISSAAALKSECFGEDLSGISQADFFDFLNGGAGGTRQWDVALSKGVRDDTPGIRGFMIHHAVVDAIYAAKLCQERGLPSLSIMPMVSIALAFAYLLNKYEGAALATHAIVREMIKANADDIDAFVNKNVDYNDVETSINNSIDALPERVKQSVLLDVSSADF